MVLKGTSRQSWPEFTSQLHVKWIPPETPRVQRWMTSWCVCRGHVGVTDQSHVLYYVFRNYPTQSRTQNTDPETLEQTRWVFIFKTRTVSVNPEVTPRNSLTLHGSVKRCFGKVVFGSKSSRTVKRWTPWRSWDVITPIHGVCPSHGVLMFPSETN